MVLKTHHIDKKNDHSNKTNENSLLGRKIYIWIKSHLLWWNSSTVLKNPKFDESSSVWWISTIVMKSHQFDETIFVRNSHHCD